MIELQVFVMLRWSIRLCRTKVMLTPLPEPCGMSADHSQQVRAGTFHPCSTICAIANHMVSVVVAALISVVQHLAASETCYFLSPVGLAELVETVAPVLGCLSGAVAVHLLVAGQVSSQEALRHRPVQESSGKGSCTSKKVDHHCIECCSRRICRHHM